MSHFPLLDCNPPLGCIDTFENMFDETDVDWASFCAMTISERAECYRLVKAGNNASVELEHYIAAESRRLRDTWKRTSVARRITAAIKNLRTTAALFNGDEREVSDDGDSPQPTRGGISMSSLPLIRISDRFVGLKNQSSTCYLNALIQSLFHLPIFRDIIYRVPTDPTVQPSESIPLALQLVFLGLQRKRNSVRTESLTAAFGWDRQEAAVQHDIHELLRKLLDVLENETATSPPPMTDAIQRLFSGQMLYYTKCLDVDYTSRRLENFYDVELVVKGNGSLEGSLQALVKPERMDGSNKYCWEHDDDFDPVTKKPRKSYHDADRGVAFQSLPPVLMIHPNRLEFDMNTFQRVTVNDKWTFPTEIDMTPYVADGSPTVCAAAASPAKAASDANGDAPSTGDEGSKTPPPKATTTQAPSTPPTAQGDGGGMMHRESSGMMGGGSATPSRAASGIIQETHHYVLRAVVIHSGFATAGHYYCYICFDGAAWVKFNDDVVTDVTFDTVMADAQGGEVMSTYSKYPRASTTRASMLVYVRKSQIDTVVFEIPESLIPSHLFEVAEAADRAASENSTVGKIPCYVVEHDEEGRYLNALRDPTSAATTKYFDKELRVKDQFNLLSCECWVSGEPSSFNSRDRIKSRLVRESDVQLSHITLWVSSTGTLVSMPFSTFHGNKEARVEYSTECPVMDVGDTDRPTLVDELLLLHILEYVAPSSDGSAVGTFRYKCMTRTRLEFSLLTVVQNRNILILVDFPAEKKISPPIKSITQLVSGDIVLLIDPDLPGASLAARAYALKHYSVSVTVEKLNPVDETDRLATTMELQLLEDMTYEQVQHAIWEALGKPGKEQRFDPQRYGLRNHNVMNDAPTPHMQLPEKQERDDMWVGETLRTFLSFHNTIPVRKVYYEILPQELTAQRIGRETLWDFTCYVGRKALHFYWHPKDKDARSFVEGNLDLLKDFINTAAKAFDLPPERIRLLSLKHDGRLEQSSLHSESPSGYVMTWSFSDVKLDLLPEGIAHPPSYFGSASGTKPQMTFSSVRRNRLQRPPSIFTSMTEKDSLTTTTATTDTNGPLTEDIEMTDIQPLTFDDAAATTSSSAPKDGSAASVTHRDPLAGVATVEQCGDNEASTQPTASDGQSSSTDPLDDFDRRRAAEAARVAVAELAERTDGLLIDVQHICRRSGEDYFGTPTVVRLRPEDTCDSIMDRIAAHLGISDEADRKGWRLFFRTTSYISGAPTPVTKEFDLWALVKTGFENRRTLLLDHPTESLITVSGAAGGEKGGRRGYEPELRIHQRVQPTQATSASSALPAETDDGSGEVVP